MNFTSIVVIVEAALLIVNHSQRGLRILPVTLPLVVRIRWCRGVIKVRALVIYVVEVGLPGIVARWRSTRTEGRNIIIIIECDIWKGRLR